MRDDDTPCECPRCGWLGLHSDTHEYRPTDADFNELEAIYVCPKCTDEIEVKYTTIEALELEHMLLTRGLPVDRSAQAGLERAQKKLKIELLLERLDRPISQVSRVTQKFREMMLSGRINELMVEAVEADRNREATRATRYANEELESEIPKHLLS